MPAKKTLQFNQVVKSFLYTSIGFAGMVGSGMAGIESLGLVDFGLIDYAMPLIIGTGLAFGVVWLEGALSLLDNTRFKRRKHKLHLSNINRSIVTKNNNKSLFAKTVLLPGMSIVESSTQGHIESDEWVVFLSGRVVPYKKANPVIISENFLLSFLELVWNRQQNQATKNKAMSRTFFCSKNGFCDVPNYYALVGLISSYTWGRGEGLVGCWLFPLRGC
jgi:hypothetical protein